MHSFGGGFIDSVTISESPTVFAELCAFGHFIKRIFTMKEETYLDKTGYAVMGAFIGLIIGHLLTIYSLTIPLGQ